MLTLKQEKYVQNLVKGMSQREAYKKSYNATKMKDKTIDDKASLLFKKEEIRARYDELIEKVRSKSEEKTIMSATERMEWLTRVVQGKEKDKYAYFNDGELVELDKEIDTKEKIKALDVLNKMDGQYTTNIKGSLNIGYEETLKQTMSDNEY